MFIGGEMIWSSTGKGKPFNLAGATDDPGPFANAHRLGFTVDRYCDVVTVSGEGHAKNSRQSSYSDQAIVSLSLRSIRPQ